MKKIEIKILPCEENYCQCLDCFNSDCASCRCSDCTDRVVDCKEHRGEIEVRKELILSDIIFFSACLADGSRSAICAAFYAARFGEIQEDDKRRAEEKLKSHGIVTE